MGFYEEQMAKRVATLGPPPPRPGDACVDCYEDWQVLDWWNPVDYHPIHRQSFYVPNPDADADQWDCWCTHSCHAEPEWIGDVVVATGAPLAQSH